MWTKCLGDKCKDDIDTLKYHISGDSQRVAMFAVAVASECSLRS
jgi:hypothetical protein